MSSLSSGRAARFHTTALRIGAGLLVGAILILAVLQLVNVHAVYSRLSHLNVMFASLDLLVLDATGAPARPWLTVIEDDHSRAVAGYTVSLAAPSALNTALALRQAIWRKTDPAWPICGIPEVLCSDHGSDFRRGRLDEGLPIAGSPAGGRVAWNTRAPGPGLTAPPLSAGSAAPAAQRGDRAMRVRGGYAVG